MDQKQYVLIFSTAYLPYIGGAELAIKEITDRIHDLRFILITARMRRDLPPRERMGNVDVYRVGVGVPFIDKILSPILGARRVFMVTRRMRVCLFWSSMVSYTTITPAFLKMFGLYRNTPFLLTLQEGDSEKHIQGGWFGLIAYWWRASLRYANHVQVISTYLEKLAGNFGYNGSVSVVPNGVDTQKFKVQSSKFKDKKNQNTILTVSRLVEKNGIDTLIRAFAEVYKKFPDAKLHIVGDGELRTDLEALARRAGVERAVTFFGSVPNENLPQYLTAADVFVRPSRSEGLGTAFLEAMACGVPIIGTPVGGIVDFLKDGETGLFCHAGDPHDLAEKIIMLLDDVKLCAKLQNNGRRLVEERYTWDGIALQMKTIFDNLCISS